MLGIGKVRNVENVRTDINWHTYLEPQAQADLKYDGNVRNIRNFRNVRSVENMRNVKIAIGQSFLKL